MSLKRLLIGMAAVLGFGAHQAGAVAAPPSQARQIAAVKNGTTTRAIEADLAGRFSSGIAHALYRDSGHTPYEWGISRQCARMRRKNRMRGLGIRGARI